MSEQKMSISFKETATIKEVILVLNALDLYTDESGLIENLRNNDNVILKEINDKEM